MASMLATCLLALTAFPVGAWTLLRNNFGSDPDNPGNPVTCNDESPWWCIEWPLQNGYSSTTYVYLDPSLDENRPDETVNMKKQARNAFDRWNAVAAREPTLVEVTTRSASSGSNYSGCGTWIERVDFLPTGVLAATRDFTPYDIVESGSHNLIVCSWVQISTRYKFVANNNDADYCYTHPIDCYYDVRWVMTHELGHLLGLGHTAYAAVMYPQWPNSKYLSFMPASNDVAGLQAAYGAP